MLCDRVLLAKLFSKFLFDDLNYEIVARNKISVTIAFGSSSNISRLNIQTTRGNIKKEKILEIYLKCCMQLFIPL